jgi:hypothetical protein
MFPYGETVTVVTPATDPDDYSLDPGNPESEVDIPGCGVEPRPSDEPTQDARNAVTSGFTLYLPPGTEITPQQRVQVRGGTYAVLGEPAVWRSPFTGWEPGVVVQVERTTG